MWASRWRLPTAEWKTPGRGRICCHTPWRLHWMNWPCWRWSAIQRLLRLFLEGRAVSAGSTECGNELPARLPDGPTITTTIVCTIDDLASEFGCQPELSGADEL